jgi:hypothetical protein
VGHTTKHTDVVARDVEEKVGRCFIAYYWFKNFLLVANREPLSSFETCGREKYAPVKCHSPRVVVNKV